MTSQLTASIAMSTYNGERFLPAQLQSLADQTRLPAELVVCDDGSSDDTLPILERFAEAAPFPVTVHRNSERLGSTGSFARAARLCRGDLVALADQDDVWLPQKLERAATLLKQHQHLSGVFSDAALVDDDLTPLDGGLWRRVGFTRRQQRAWAKGRAVSVLIRQNVVPGMALTVRREVLEVGLPIPDGWFHDEWLALVAAGTRELRPIPEQLVLYRQHPGQELGAGPSVRASLARNAARTPAGRYRAAAAKLETLRTRLEMHAGAMSRGALEQVDDAVRHLERRAAVQEMGLRGLPSVLQELLGGGYHRHGRGVASAAADVVAAARRPSRQTRGLRPPTASPR